MPGTRKFSKCESCNKIDNHNMVQCDDCDLWFHYICVGVGPEIKNFDWSCLECRCKKISTISSETYQLAKSSEESISRKRRKQTQANRATTIQPENKRSVQEPNKSNFMNEEVKRMIDEGIRDALAKYLKKTVNGSEVNENVVDSNVSVANTVHATLHEATVYEESVHQATVVYEKVVYLADVYEEPIYEVTVYEEPVYEITVNETNGSSKGIAELNIAFPISREEVLDEFNCARIDFQFYIQKFSKKGHLKLSTTMTIVSNQIVADSLLRKYSYEGHRRTKKMFSSYENVENVIVSATMLAFNNYNSVDEGFQSISKEEVQVHYRTKHITYAAQRDDRAKNKK